MGRNMLIGAALAAVLVSFGVVTGVAVERRDRTAPSEPAPQLLVADAEPELVGHGEPAPLVHSLDGEILERLTALEKAVAAQGERYDAMAKRLGPAVEIIELINSQRNKRRPTGPAANETAAIAVGRNIISAQAQLQATGRVDVDSDGTGEYGGFLEMSGAVPGRMSKALVPPVLSGTFRVISESGEATRNGYVYRIFLPDAKGRGVGEEPGGYQAGDIEADLAETTWCMYAWPIEYGKTGTRTFFTNQGGDTLATDDAAYSGLGNGPGADAAFKLGHGITGIVSIGVEGHDGNTWKQVN